VAQEARTGSPKRFEEEVSKCRENGEEVDIIPRVSKFFKFGNPSPQVAHERNAVGGESGLMAYVREGAAGDGPWDGAGEDDGGQASVNPAELLRAARALIEPGRRRLLGIAGAPGAGKSTLAEWLARGIGADAVLVSLDGFHLAEAELHRLDRHDRKGAPDTFDAHGYVNLLRRLRDRADAVVYAPRFDRSIEESIAGSVAVPRDVPLVITEGNYLLVDTPEWRPIRALLDVCWYVEPGEAVRLERLVARHVAFGRTPAAARDRSYGSDQRNAEVIQATRDRADLVIRVPGLPLTL
jgi:pantothenate kinase